MIPKLGATVLFAVLSNEAAQSFIAAAGIPVGDAVIQPTPYPGGFRAATVVGIVGNPENKRVALVIYKQPGDPFRSPDGGDALIQRLGDVPYSDTGEPGTWLTQEDVDALEAEAPKERKAKPAETPKAKAPEGSKAKLVEPLTVEQLKAMGKDDVFAWAKKYKIDLGEVTTLRDAVPIVAAHYKLTLPE